MVTTAYSDKLPSKQEEKASLPFHARFQAYPDLCLASRRHPKPQVSYGHLRSNASRKHPAQKDPPGLTLHKPLRSKFSKAQVSKSKGNFKPSRLGMASLTLADVEREAGEDQTLQEKDPNGRITVVSPTKHPADDAGLKTLDGDLLMAGQE